MSWQGEIRMRCNHQSRWLTNTISIVLALSLQITGVTFMNGETPSDQAMYRRFRLQNQFNR